MVIHVDKGPPDWGQGQDAIYLLSNIHHTTPPQRQGEGRQGPRQQQYK